MSLFSQSLLRAGRHVLRQPRAVNPSSDLLATSSIYSQCKRWATSFERSKPHVNIGLSSVRLLEMIVD